MIARLAIVGGPGSDFDALIAAASDRAAGRPVDLTIIVIARRPVAWRFAPLTGRVTPEQLSRDAREAGAGAARRALGRVGGDVRARYMAVERRRQLRRSLAAQWAQPDAVLFADDLPRHPWNRWRRESSCASSLNWRMAAG